MPELESLQQKIHELREQLHYLLSQKKDPLDPEVIAVSRMLDVQLFEFEKILTGNITDKKEKEDKNIRGK